MHVFASLTYKHMLTKSKQIKGFYYFSTNISSFVFSLCFFIHVRLEPVIDFGKESLICFDGEEEGQGNIHIREW